MAVAKAVELLGVQTKDPETPLQQPLHDRMVRILNGDSNRPWVATILQEFTDQVGKAFDRMLNLKLLLLLAVAIQDTDSVCL